MSVCCVYIFFFVSDGEVCRCARVFWFRLAVIGWIVFWFVGGIGMRVLVRRVLGI